MENKTLQQLRQEYSSRELNETGAGADPLPLFEKWFEEAVNAGLREPNAMTLATANIDFKPSARIVLLKGLEEGAFVFFTNYQSRKGKELLWNPYATLLFFWIELSRQVRIEGRVAKVSAEVSDEYFQSRPEGSRLGALVSPQSEIISGRDELEEKMKTAQSTWAGKNIPRPDHWGGYKVVPHSIEFWQGRENRLHDRLRFTRIENDEWKRERLAP
jgi:pyridoxamine 5'-phosphate oxidase